VVIAGLMPSYLTFALMLPICGLTALTLITGANSFVQMSTEAHVRGRVMALYLAIFMGGTPVGAPLLGWVAEQYGARWTLVGGGALTMVGTLVSVAVFTRTQGLTIRGQSMVPVPAIPVELLAE
jgi:MFS family permease